MIALYGTPIWKSIRNNFSQQHIWKHISNFSQQLPEHINSVTSGPRACSGNVSMCIWYVLGGHRPFPSVLWHVFGCFADFWLSLWALGPLFSFCMCTTLCYVLGALCYTMCWVGALCYAMCWVGAGWVGALCYATCWVHCANTCEGP